jgi:hypothetical protein
MGYSLAIFRLTIVTEWRNEAKLGAAERQSTTSCLLCERAISANSAAFCGTRLRMTKALSNAAMGKIDCEPLLGSFTPSSCAALSARPQP